MTVDEDWTTTGDPAGGPARDRATPDGLGPAVASLYADLRLTPTLHTLLAHSRRLVGGVAGSISVVDPTAGTYSKIAERGIACRLGDTFSLAEGATGAAFSHRGPVVIDDYSALTARHLPPDHPANRGSVVAVPIWWRGDLIGVNVAFAGHRRRFSTGEIDRLDVLTQTAAGAIVTAGAGEPSLAHLIRARALHRTQDLRRLVQQGPDQRAAGAAGTAGTAGTARTAGTAEIERAPGWDVLLRAEFPYGLSPTTPPAEAPTPDDASSATPLTRRETEVLTLVARGLGDREIARRLVLSPRTVEKHVGSAMRKAGASSRTGAAVHALAHGWVEPDGR